jgi:tetratricopeptide (TPR) repeat protein
MTMTWKKLLPWMLLLLSACAEGRTVTESEATAAMMRGDFARSIPLWNRVLSEDPKNADAYRDRATAKVAVEDLQGALADYNESLVYAPRVGTTYLYRGAVWEAMGRWDDAIVDYNRVLQLEPRADDALNNRGHAYGGKGAWPQAIQDFESALILNPRSDIARLNLALAFLETDQPKRALAIYAKASERERTFADFQAAYAVALWQSNRSKESALWMGKALKQEPRYGDRTWLQTLRRWPPKVVEKTLAMQKALKLKLPKSP